MMKLKLWYFIPGNTPEPYDTGNIDFARPENTFWLWHMVESNPDTIFFFTDITTDIQEF